MFALKYIGYRKFPKRQFKNEMMRLLKPLTIARKKFTTLLDRTIAILDTECETLVNI